MSQDPNPPPQPPPPGPPGKGAFKKPLLKAGSSRTKTNGRGGSSSSQNESRNVPATTSSSHAPAATFQASSAVVDGEKHSSLPTKSSLAQSTSQKTPADQSSTTNRRFSQDRSGEKKAPTQSLIQKKLSFKTLNTAPTTPGSKQGDTSTTLSAGPALAAHPRLPESSPATDAQPKMAAVKTKAPQRADGRTDQTAGISVAGASETPSAASDRPSGGTTPVDDRDEQDQEMAKEPDIHKDSDTIIKLFVKMATKNPSVLSLHKEFGAYFATSGVKAVYRWILYIDLELSPESRDGLGISPAQYPLPPDTRLRYVPSVHKQKYPDREWGKREWVIREDAGVPVLVPYEASGDIIKPVIDFSVFQGDVNVRISEVYADLLESFREHLEERVDLKPFLRKCSRYFHIDRTYAKIPVGMLRNLVHLKDPKSGKEIIDRQSFKNFNGFGAKQVRKMETSRAPPVLEGDHELFGRFILALKYDIQPHLVRDQFPELFDENGHLHQQHRPWLKVHALGPDATQFLLRRDQVQWCLGTLSDWKSIEDPYVSIELPQLRRGDPDVASSFRSLAANNTAADLSKCLDYFGRKKDFADLKDPSIAGSLNSARTTILSSLLQCPRRIPDHDLYAFCCSTLQSRSNGNGVQEGLSELQASESVTQVLTYLCPSVNDCQSQQDIVVLVALSCGSPFAYHQMVQEDAFREFRLGESFWGVRLDFTQITAIARSNIRALFHDVLEGQKTAPSVRRREYLTREAAALAKMRSLEKAHMTTMVPGGYYDDANKLCFDDADFIEFSNMKAASQSLTTVATNELFVPALQIAGLRAAESSDTVLRFKFDSAKTPEGGRLKWYDKKTRCKVAAVLYVADVRLAPKEREEAYKTLRQAPIAAKREVLSMYSQFSWTDQAKIDFNLVMMTPVAGVQNFRVYLPFPDDTLDALFVVPISGEGFLTVPFQEMGEYIVLSANCKAGNEKKKAYLKANTGNACDFAADPDSGMRCVHVIQSIDKIRKKGVFHKSFGSLIQAMQDYCDTRHGRSWREHLSNRSARASPQSGTILGETQSTSKPQP